jgi:hypothetical protein
MMEAVSTSETLVNFFATTRHKIPEDRHCPLYLNTIQQKYKEDMQVKPHAFQTSELNGPDTYSQGKSHQYPSCRNLCDPRQGDEEPPPGLRLSHFTHNLSLTD